MDQLLNEPLLMICTQLMMALLLAWAIGYERFFNGRASGSQVYCLVGVTSCAITLISGYPELWFGGRVSNTIAGDPTRVIGSIVTGVGFLGSGIIVQSGTSVRGLTTAATVWAAAAIGILVGVDCFAAAMALTTLCVATTALVPRLERRLPARTAIAATLKFRHGVTPRPEAVATFLHVHGLSMPNESLTVELKDGRFELRCLIVANAFGRSDEMSTIAFALSHMPEVEDFKVTHSNRN